MSRLATIDPAQASGETRELLDAVQHMFGFIPNGVRALASSTAALKACLVAARALAGGQLDPELRAQIAIGIAEATECGYCLDGHCYMAKHVEHLSDEAIQESRQFSSSNHRVDAALTFARAVVDREGSVSDADVEQVRAAGYSDGEIAEIVVCVGLNLLTSFFNKVANTEADSLDIAPAEGAA